MHSVVMYLSTTSVTVTAVRSLLLAFAGVLDGANDVTVDT
jgi:hypothetical protein